MATPASSSLDFVIQAAISVSCCQPTRPLHYLLVYPPLVTVPPSLPSFSFPPLIQPLPSHCPFSLNIPFYTFCLIPLLLYHLPLFFCLLIYPNTSSILLLYPSPLLPYLIFPSCSLTYFCIALSFFLIFISCLILSSSSLSYTPEATPMSCFNLSCLLNPQPTPHSLQPIQFLPI